MARVSMQLLILMELTRLKTCLDDFAREAASLTWVETLRVVGSTRLKNRGLLSLERVHAPGCKLEGQGLKFFHSQVPAQFWVRVFDDLGKAVCDLQPGDVTVSMAQTSNKPLSWDVTVTTPGVVNVLYVCTCPPTESLRMVITAGSALLWAGDVFPLLHGRFKETSYKLTTFEKDKHDTLAPSLLTETHVEVAVTPDGSHILTSYLRSPLTSQRFQLYSAETGLVVETFECAQSSIHHALVITPKATVLHSTVGSVQESTLTGKLLRNLVINAEHLAADDRVIVAGHRVFNQYSVVVVDYNTGLVVNTYFINLAVEVTVTCLAVVAATFMVGSTCSDGAEITTFCLRSGRSLHVNSFRMWAMDPDFRFVPMNGRCNMVMYGCNHVLYGYNTSGGLHVLNYCAPNKYWLTMATFANNTVYVAYKTELFMLT